VDGEKPPIGKRLRDLCWLVGVIYRCMPGFTIAWIAASLVSGIAFPLQAWAGAELIDSIGGGPGGGPASSPWFWLGVMALTFVATRLVTVTLYEYYAAGLRERAAPMVQARVYDHATTIDLALYENQAFYDRMSRILTEAESRTPKVVNNVSDVIVSVPRVAGYCFILALIDWRLPIIALVPFLPLLWGWVVVGQIYWDVLSNQTRERRLATYYASQLTDRASAKEVRLFGLQQHLLANWSENYWKTRNELRRKGLGIALRQRGATLVASLLIVGALIWIITDLPAGVSAGDITVIAQTFILVPGVMSYAGGAIKDLGESSGYASDMRAFIDLPTPHRVVADGSNGGQAMGTRHASGADAIRRAPVAGSGRLAIEGLTFSYPGTSTPVVQDLSVEIEPGERVAIVGENGAGKTTLIKLALGLYAPDAGRIALDGEDLATMPAAERQRRLSAIFQHFTRYPFTIAENITLTRDEKGADGQLAWVLELAGMSSFVGRQRDGVDTLLAPDLGGVDLSGGQWQRLAIARAGWRGADVLVLDEPTAALDPMAEVALFRRFADLARGRTTLLVSHRLGMARLADRILVLEHGRLIESGSHDALRAAGGRYAEMWDMQVRWYR
jgi:ABC-type multidrug transport system fused ATPase/permease subunit